MKQFLMSVSSIRVAVLASVLVFVSCSEASTPTMAFKLSYQAGIVLIAQVVVFQGTEPRLALGATAQSLITGISLIIRSRPQKMD